MLSLYRVSCKIDWLFDECHSVYRLNAILFTDLRKTFDTTDQILLSKLELYGFKGASLNLFRDYISDRTQFTVVNHVYSETR